MHEQDWIARLRDNVARVRASIAAACRRAARDPSTVCLVGVTKYVSPAVLREVVAAGVVDLGENHAQQLVARARECGVARFDWPGAAGAGSGPRWHMLGHVQRNKVKTLLPLARIIHSLDSERLARALEQHAAELAVSVNVLIEVNMAGEANKTGIAPDAVDKLVEATRGCSHLCLRGLMTMAPYTPDPEEARPYFARLRQLLERLRQAEAVGPDCVHLSMGMSLDYGVGIEEGATLVRVGSALFEGLPTSDPRQTDPPATLRL